MTKTSLKEILFLARPFYISSAVHTPRASTEFISASGYIAYLQQLAKPSLGQSLSVADVGIGCGATAVSWALECPQVAKVYGVDLSDEAVTLAKANAGRLKADSKVSVLQGDLFAPLLQTPIDVIIANLPCASDEQIAYMRQHGKLKDEPIATIHGGKTGFELYERLCQQLENYRYLPGVAGIWLFGCTDHLAQVKRLHARQFPGFELMAFKDKYKPYFLHYLFTRTTFQPGEHLVLLERQPPTAPLFPNDIKNRAKNV